MSDRVAASKPAASPASTQLAETDAALAARFDRNADIDDLLRDRARAVDARNRIAEYNWRSRPIEPRIE